jgi:hypothetical protein
VTEAHALASVKAAAAVRALLPALRARLLELCDLNAVVRDIKLASTAAAAGAGAGAGSEAAAAAATVAALWEEAKVRSAYILPCPPPPISPPLLSLSFSHTLPTLHHLLPPLSAGLTRLVAAAYAIAALTCLARVHFTLYQRITTHARAHVVAEAERHARGPVAAAAPSSAIPSDGEEKKAEGARNGEADDGAAPAPSPREASAAAGVAYDRIAQERQEQCLRAVCDVLLGEGLESLVRHVSVTVRLATSTPAYSVTGDGGKATSVTQQHFRGLVDALVSAAEPPALTRGGGGPRGVGGGGGAASPAPDYSPCLVLSLLLPATRAVRAPAPVSDPRAGRGGGMAASALVALATSRSPTAASAAATAGLLPVPWSSQLLVDLTLDAVRSPAAQAGLRHAVRSLVTTCAHPAVDRAVFGGTAAGGTGERALGPAVMALRGATDELLAAAAPAVLQAGAPADPVVVASASPPLSELCYQLMWTAKLA